MRLRFLVGFF
jgi:hypothetical protein